MAGDTQVYQLEGQHYEVPKGTSLDELDSYIKSQSPYTEAGAAAHPPFASVPNSITETGGRVEPGASTSKNAERATALRPVRDALADPFKKMGSGAQEIGQGQVTRGMHHVIQGVGEEGLIAAPQLLAAAPLASALGIGTAVAGGALGKIGSKALGATDDQSDLAGDISGLVSGYGGMKLAGALPAIGDWAGRTLRTPGQLTVTGDNPQTINTLKPGIKAVASIGKLVGGPQIANAIIPAHPNPIGEFEPLPGRMPKPVDPVLQAVQEGRASRLPTRNPAPPFTPMTESPYYDKFAAARAAAREDAVNAIINRPGWTATLPTRIAGSGGAALGRIGDVGSDVSVFPEPREPLPQDRPGVMYSVKRKTVLPESAQRGARQFYKSQEHTIVFPNGSRIFFDSAENKQDVERKAFGPEFMDIFVDQAEQFTEWELKQLKTTCRWPNMPEHACKFCLFFNPGGPGAAFLRRVFHTFEYHENERSEDYEFLQMYGWDNVEWSRAALREDGIEDQINTGSANDYYQWSEEKRFTYFITRSQYRHELNALPESMRLGQLMGEFTKFAGQYFTIFDPARHVKSVSMREWMRRWISIDWGYDHPSAVYWHCATDADNVHTYREFVAREMTPRVLAEAIARLSGTERISAIMIDPSAKARRDSPETIYLQLNAVLREKHLPSCILADNDRVGGWMLAYQMLDSDSWTIDPSCLKLIDCLPMLLRDPDKDSDVLKVDGDDPADSARYGLKYHLAQTTKPKEIRDREEAEKIDDPLARHFFLAKRQQEKMSEIFTPHDVMPWEQ